MRHALFSRFLISMLLLSVARAAEPAVTLTLEQALASVEKVNLNVLLSREAAIQALEQTAVARAAIFPTVAGSLQQRRTKSVPLTNTGATSARPTNRFDG